MKFLHTRIRVSDLDKTISFYEKLGFACTKRMDSPTGNKLAYLEVPGNAHLLELCWSPEYKVAVPEDLMHTCVGVDDIISYCDASSGGVFDSTPPSKPEMPSTAILSAGSDHAEQLNTPLAAAVASPGTSRLAGEESTPGKAKIRHGGGVPIPVSAYAASSFQIQRYNQPVRHYESVPFTRSADYYIYTLRRIII